MSVDLFIDGSRYTVIALPKRTTDSRDPRERQSLEYNKETDRMLGLIGIDWAVLGSFGIE